MPSFKYLTLDVCIVDAKKDDYLKIHDKFIGLAEADPINWINLSDEPAKKVGEELKAMRE